MGNANFDLNSCFLFSHGVGRDKSSSLHLEHQHSPSDRFSDISSKMSFSPRFQRNHHKLFYHLVRDDSFRVLRKTQKGGDKRIGHFTAKETAYGQY